MLAQPQELVKAAGSAGYAAKLAFAFTHFENVTGDDLYAVDDRKDRVRLPGEDAIATMQSIVGDDVAEELLGQLTAIRQRVRGQLQSTATKRVATRYLTAWERAYEHSGPGSGYRRADELDGIYRHAAPAIGFHQSAEAPELLNVVYAALQTAADEVGGRLE